MTIPPINLNLDMTAKSGVNGDSGSSAVSGGMAQPVVIDSFAKWALVAGVVLVGLVVVARLAAKK